MHAIFKEFGIIGEQPEILYMDDDGALTNKWVAGEFEKQGSNT